MKWRKLTHNGTELALVEPGEPIIHDGQSALDVLMTLRYDSGTGNLIFPSGRFAPDFYKLSTGVAGDVLQKVANYRLRLAVLGDFSAFNTPAFKAFVAESNRGNAVFFCKDEQEAIACLSESR